MRARLTIGVVHPGPGMRTVLEGLGVAWEVVARWDDSLDPTRYSAVIVNALLDRDRLAVLRRYLRAGGAVLDTGQLLPVLVSAHCRRTHIGSVVPAADDDLFGDIHLLDVHRSVKRHTGARYLGGLVHLSVIEGGPVAYLPVDIDRAVMRLASVRKRFPVDGTGYCDEITARVSKGELSLVVERCLWWLHEQRGLPYLHRWPFPGRERGIFAYRIDSDYGTREQIEELHLRARRNDVPLTWFLHVAAHERWLERFREFAPDEVGVHCYRHRTFASAEENSANIREAYVLLERAGIMPGGFAAPNGFYNRGLAAALEETGFDYSSEFSLDYDNFPFHPRPAGEWSPVLQVPVHPVCIGSLVRAHVPEEVMARYFRGVIDRRLRLRRPAILYHHPGHEHWDVMEDSFRHAAQQELRRITMGEYARWWRRRSAVRFEASLEGNSIVMRSVAGDPDVSVALRRSDGAVTFIEAGTTQLDTLRPDIEQSPPVVRPAGIKGARRFSIRTLQHAIEDYNARARQ